MNSNWKEEAWKTEVHVMADRTIKTKMKVGRYMTGANNIIGQEIKK